MKFSKKLIIVCLILGMLFLTGCGIEVKTNMTIDNYFKGSKVISCFVSKQDMNLHFKGDSSKIDAMIDNHCPGCFDYSKNETKSGTEYIFTLNFSSLDDYIAALRSVLNFNPEVKFKGVDSIFSQSIDFTENFTSIDLLRWFEILLTEEYNMKANQLESLWDMKDTTVTWMNRLYTSSKDSIQVSDHKYSEFDGISIYTEEHEDRTFTRRIQFAIPKSTLDTRVLELEQLFKDIKPEGTTGIWTTTDSGKIYEITFQGDTFHTLSEKTGQAFNAKSQNIQNDVSLSDNQYLRLNIAYSETLDFARFLSTTMGEVPVSYYFKPNSFTEINSERLQKEINNAFVPKEYGDGYYRIYQGNCSTLKITTLCTMFPPVSSCDITTTFKNNNIIHRKFIFTLKDILHQNEEDYLSSMAKSSSTDLMELEFAEGKSNHTLTIVQTGLADELNQISTLFGSDNNYITIEEPGFLDLISNEKRIYIAENIDMTDFLGPSSDSALIHYEFHDQSSNNMEHCYLINDTSEEIEPVSIEERTCIFENTGCRFTSHYTGSTPSILGISIFIILIIFIIIGILLFIKMNPMKTNKANQE